MYNSRKKAVVDQVFEMSTIWCCSNESCKVWMRDNFSFSVAPTCVQCKSVMVKKEREIGVVENMSPINTLKT